MRASVERISEIPAMPCQTIPKGNTLAQMRERQAKAGHFKFKMCKLMTSDAWRSAPQSGDREERDTGEYAVRRAPMARSRPRMLKFGIFMDEEEKEIFRSIGERLDKLDKVLAILERIEGRQIKVKEEIEQEIKEQPVVGSFASKDK
jgi:hypothetical protein